MTTLENNKNIAELILGIKTCTEQEFLSYEKGGDDLFIIEGFKFHSSWDSLMPVVSKIYDMDVYISYVDETSGMFKNSIELTTNINKVYESVVDFVNWFLENRYYPSKKGQIVKFHTPLEDEDPNQKYMVVEMRGTRVLVKPFGDESKFSPTFSYNRKDLTVIL